MKPKDLIFLLLLTFVSCESDVPTFKQKILFEMHYTNWAWGYQNRGYLIDSLGYVRGFDLSKKTAEWNNPDSAGYLAKDKMDKNLAFCDVVICKLSPDTLSHYVGKIWGASKGTLSKPDMQMADFGELVYSAYVYEEKTNRYKVVMVKTYGDWMLNNSSEEAEEIYAWMNRINGQKY
jgi:hypothetical protein